ncbi:unnamed protein product [Cyclocybe aegerita]|uniref:G-patch domain-containing protein n=1 Tax=Cyclocybe aegerita TaxID=1973307 RepID=A0A8S0WZV8_CYCAE|nr:unnamed protein product [Cyclocybe aegerita]
MATTAYHIYSHYDPKDREALEKETGQHTDEDLSPEEAWHREASRISRQRGPAPQFVPATISYDEWSSGQASISQSPESSSNALGGSLSGWYRSLTSSRSGTPGSATPAPPSTQQQHEENSDALATSLPPIPSHAGDPPLKPKERRNKNNWFIMKAIQSEPPPSVSTPTPSLADILARDPPPFPSDKKYTPPVWLEIGPSNKGFGMLQRSGWNEGEPLGPDVVRRKPIEAVVFDGDIIPASSSKGKGKLRQELKEVRMESFDDVSELRRVDVIDLTQSDSELDDEPSPTVQNETTVERKVPGAAQGPQPSAQSPMLSDGSPAYERKALLTPIATVLKSDRLGIGLKAKTVGRYKASQKRVTHNAAALAAHVKAAEENRRRQKLFGRGAKGFQRRHQAEEERRKAMAAYLKSI